MITVRQSHSMQFEGYSATVMSSVTDIQRLKPSIIRAIPQCDILFDPEFFLASLSSEWGPKVVALHNGNELAGIVYAKESIVGGLRLGVVYADLSLGGVPIGEFIQRQDTFRIALETVLASPGIRGMRLRILRSSPELAAVREIVASRRFDTHFSRVKDHAVLPLPESYEQMLQRFGSTTRRNFRYYRRRFEGAGHTYLESLAMDELRSAAFYLDPRCAIPSRPESIERMLKMVAAANQPLIVGLKHKNGEWLSIIGGLYRLGSGVVLLQLNNDRNFPRDSLSVVLRAYLIETLIRQGTKELIFWAGTAAPLSRYVTFVPTLGIYIDRPDYGWRLVRRTVSKFGPWLPKRARADARWIAPFS
jgi:hypothetical protein